MSSVSKKRIAVLTGGGDCPGLNPAVCGVSLRAMQAGYEVVGFRRGWAGLVDTIREKGHDNSNNFQILNEQQVRRAGRTGGTFLHTSRTNPSKVKSADVPEHLQSSYHSEKNDLTPDVLKTLEWLGIDCLVPIGGDDTLSYGVRLFKEGYKVVAIPKTMDNDVPGTDICLGFSTAVTRTLECVNYMRTSAGSHERFLVIEVFGRYAGFTAMLPAMAGAADRCVIPEHKFDIERLTELLSEDRRKNPSRYSIVLVSEGAVFEGGHMVFENQETDAFGHKKLGGIGERVARKLKELSPKYNGGRAIECIEQKLGYIVRGGDPDANDSLIPRIWGNMAVDLIEKGEFGRLVVLKNGRYGHVPINTVTSTKKLINVEEDYDTEQLRPRLGDFENKPVFLL